ncbi:hypothetical protein TNCT_119531 [Trichonephila clavata]|uniref:Uncharacterized protein n=1 Tax=Trichonephila clavata TaxID=2740835 RepID=A0A8X6JKA1_TRICU|nr:hypothetical protein TNCT_119531 [Trichonephila clavata]
MGNHKNKSRSQKRKFTGNHYTERNKPLDVSTVSEQMLSTTSISTENIASNDDKMSGHRIFDMKILQICVGNEDNWKGPFIFILCIALYLAKEGVEMNPGPIQSSVQFNYASLSNTSGEGTVAPPPNGIVFTGPAYEVNHAVNNNSVVQLTSANYDTRFSYQQHDASYPMKGSFLYPLKIGDRGEIIDEVGKSRLLPHPHRRHRMIRTRPQADMGASNHVKKNGPRKAPSFSSLFSSQTEVDDDQSHKSTT